MAASAEEVNEPTSAQERVYAAPDLLLKRREGLGEVERPVDGFAALAAASLLANSSKAKTPIRQSATCYHSSLQRRWILDAVERQKASQTREELDPRVARLPSEAKCFTEESAVAWSRLHALPPPSCRRCGQILALSTPPAI